MDNGKGKALVQTMGGQTLTATKDGGKVVLTDASGGKATIVEGDQKRSNGVIHYVDAILTPVVPRALRKALQQSTRNRLSCFQAAERSL